MPQENQSLQGGARDFWAEVARNFVDLEGDDKITFTDFIAGLSSFSHGTKEDKLEWMFRLYDADSNGVLDRQEIVSLMKGVLRAQNDSGKEWSLKAIEQKAGELFKKMDADKNGSVDKAEFVAIASQDEALSNALAVNISHSTKIEATKNDFSTFDNQVAGHSKGDAAMLKDPTGRTIMKPLADAEFDFYVHVQKNAPEHKAVFPEFNGRKAVELADGVLHYILLEDLTHGLNQPSIMDLKIGFRGHDDHAKTMKMVQQIALCSVTTSSSLGFRLCGMRYYDDSNQVVIRGKPWGAKLKKETMSQALMDFVTHHGHIRFDVVSAFLSAIEPIVRFFNTQKMYKFYSSSILFVYDADSPVGNPTVRVKLVDFAHTFPQSEKSGKASLDTNFLQALSNLTQMWTDIESFGVEIWENQRFSKSEKLFGSKFLGLVGDRAGFTNKSGKTALRFTNPSDWVVDKTSCSDSDGWWYAPSWTAKAWGDKNAKSRVRRRRWVKKSQTPRGK